MPRSLEEERQVKFPTSPLPPPPPLVISKNVHFASCPCRIQQAKKVWDEKFAMNGSLRFQVLDTLHPPPFHNPVSKFCLLKTNVRFPAHTDKHSQIYRILLPICKILSQLPTLYNWPTLHAYIDVEYGSLNRLYLAILSDFFRHAFDRTGADNFYDVGSCIDGHLTSMWNWCNAWAWQLCRISEIGNR